ncbi:MAG: hypothetical protein ABSE99_13005 [Terracidiphilus sp.]
MLKIRFAVASLGFAMLLPAFSALPAQTAAAPVPSQILTAKKVFISNTGGGFDSRVWSGGPDRIYNEFYAAMKSWGRYELVSAPGDADLVLDVNVIPNSVAWQFKLETLDPKTRIVLWTQYEPLKITVSQKTRDKNFDDTIDKLVGDLKALTTPSASK